MHCQRNSVTVIPNIDAVVYFSERQATKINQQIGFPVVSIEGKSIGQALWKRQVVQILQSRWAAWNGVPNYDSDLTEVDFTSIAHIPSKMSLNEKWQLDYRRRPYMSSFTDEQIHARFDEVICVNLLAFRKDAPIRPDNPTIAWSRSSMSHLMLEMAKRAIPVTKFQHDPQRLGAAAGRLNLPIDVVQWFQNDIS